MGDIEVHEKLRGLLQGFFSDDAKTYDAIKSAAADNRNRLVIDINTLNEINPQFAKRMMGDPFTFLPPAEEALQQVMEENWTGKSKGPAVGRLGLKGWLGAHAVTPRGLSARLVNKIVAVEGIVTRCSLVMPKLLRSVHFAEASQRHVVKMHADSHTVCRDKNSMSSGQHPKADSDGNPYRAEIGLSEYKDTQRFCVQEMPETAPTGQLPRSLDVVVEEDLVDSVKPGDRVRVFGVYRATAGFKDSGKLSGFARTFALCNNVERLHEEVTHPEIGPPEIRAIRNLAARPDTFEILSRSVAPSICGHDIVKQGLLLQLLGGERKELEGGMNLRGDLHVLLIGDPSCGKSQMLRFILNTAPLALSTTGRGSSGVGLTAAVTHDADTGERRLEAGAMVLSDGGLVCIDEFDKMGHEDRVAIHEVMEQQTVSISKAGIQASLNARCSILAAANPLYGTFDDAVDMRNQIAFPDSLLSRFDLIYIIRDSQTALEDRRICKQVLKQLRQGGNADVGLGVVHEREGGGQIVQPTITKAGHAGDAGAKTRIRSGTPISVDLLRKYIFYCKQHRAAPRLSDEAVSAAADFYSGLRQRFAGAGGKSKGRLSIPTARTLEACIRLATAHARLKLRAAVTREDVKVAERLLLFTLCGELLDENEDEVSSSSSDGSSDGEDKVPRRSRRQLASGTPKAPRKRKGVPVGGGSPGSALSASLFELRISPAAKKARKKDVTPRRGGDSVIATPVPISIADDDEDVERSDMIESASKLAAAVSAVRQASGDDYIAFPALAEKVAEHVGRGVSTEELDRVLQSLAAENRVMVAEGSVWFI